MHSEASTQTCGSPPPSSVLSSAPHIRPEHRAGLAVGLAWTGYFAEAHLWLDSLPVRTSFGDLQHWFLTGNKTNPVKFLTLMQFRNIFFKSLYCLQKKQKGPNCKWQWHAGKI